MTGQHRTPRLRLYTCTGTRFHTVPFLRTLEHGSPRGQPARGAPRGCKAPAEPDGGFETPQPMGQGCGRAPGTAQGL